MDFKTHYARMLAHYTALALLPGWKGHVWHRIKEMARDCPELYADLPHDVTEATNQPPTGENHAL